MAGTDEKKITRRGGNVDEDKVFQGLQKKQKCKLCEQDFLLEKLPGAISYKSVLKLRESWGLDVHYPAPALLYQRVQLCVFCSQFFEPKLGEEKSPSSPSKASHK
ncbi:hypothetical protein AKO1_007746 [Acrasis kona]|uniref:Uncharacterized protein n=1 Tax=Acrasis kona TaxID=1008807 RepID=A0AAW2YQX3_9EUKA